MGENILTTHPDAQQARQALERAEVVVVQELFPTETAELADVVFAATSLGEKDGTLTSAEGRLQTVHYALRTESQARPDWRILSDLSGEMGAARVRCRWRSGLDFLAAPRPHRGIGEGRAVAEGVAERLADGRPLALSFLPTSRYSSQVAGNLLAPTSSNHDLR